MKPTPTLTRPVAVPPCVKCGDHAGKSRIEGRCLPCAIREIEEANFLAVRVLRAQHELETSKGPDNGQS